MSLSTGEIAERIRRPGMDTGMVVERIKHWTRLKLLQPVGGRRPGTGRHYRYDELELVPVAILSALADAGASIQGLGDNLLGGLAKAQAAYDKWEAKNRQGSFFLVGTSIRGKSRSAYTFEVYEQLPRSEPGAEVTIVVDLGQVLARLPRGLAQEQEIADRVELRVERAGKVGRAGKGTGRTDGRGRKRNRSRATLSPGTAK